MENSNLQRFLDKLLLFNRSLIDRVTLVLGRPFLQTLGKLEGGLKKAAIFFRCFKAVRSPGKTH